MATIALIGPGAVGSVMAVALAGRREHRLHICARRPVEAIAVEYDGRVETIQPVVWTNPAAAQRVDWVLVTTKAYQAAATATWFPQLCGPDTYVAILQNGVEHRARFAPFLPADRIVPVIVDAPAERAGETLVRQRAPARLVVADDASGRALADLFRGTSVSVECSADFVTAAWRKLCLNAAGVLSALVLQPAGVMREEAMGEASRQLVREAIAVGRAEGARLGDELVEDVLDSYRRAPVDAVNSLHADRQAGRPTELDARNGAIVRLGQRHGIPTPANQLAVALLACLSETSRRS